MPARKTSCHPNFDVVIVCDRYIHCRRSSAPWQIDLDGHLEIGDRIDIDVHDIGLVAFDQSDDDVGDLMKMSAAADQLPNGSIVV